MMRITENAFKYIMGIRPSIKTFLRVRVVGGGCQGYQYKYDWEDYRTQGPDDTALIMPYENAAGYDFLIILVDPKSKPHLKGAVIDYEPGLHSKGLEFLNPNALNVCGCKMSFSL
jgi:iron-sulfur cluster assembly accessory protein